MPAVGAAGNSDREVYNAFSIARDGDERRANGQFAVSHPDCAARNNIGNTTGTSRADRQDESNPCAAIRPVVAMH